MPRLHQELVGIQKEILSYLVRAHKNDANSQASCSQAKHEIKTIIENTAKRMGSDLLTKHSYELTRAQLQWVCEQINALLAMLQTASPILPQAFIDIFNVKFRELYAAYGGAITFEQSVELEQIKVRVKELKKNSLTWTQLAHGGILAAHVGLLVYSASGVLATVFTVGFWTNIFSAIGAGLVWLVNQSKEVLLKISLTETAILLPLKIVGISLYALLMTPFIIRTLYKSLRNIFASKYQEKKWGSIKRLIASLFGVGAGITLGLVAGMLGWGGGPLVALGLAAMGWGLGYSFYKFYKRRRDRHIYFGCSNPQKWWLTQVQIQNALNYIKQHYPAHDNDHVALISNLIYLVTKLEEIARYEKQNRKQHRHFFYTLTDRFFGWDVNPPKRHLAEEAIRNIKRGNWNQVIANCSSLQLGLDLSNFGIAENREEMPTVSASDVVNRTVTTESPLEHIKQESAVGPGLFAANRCSPGEDPAAVPVPVTPTAPPFYAGLNATV